MSGSIVRVLGLQRVDLAEASAAVAQADTGLGSLASATSVITCCEEGF